MNLFMFYVGGNAGRSNIEVHDIQFAAAERPEDAWPFLRSVWFGDKDKIHLDGYARVNWVDGHRVVLARQPSGQSKHLYFVNTGAYGPDTLAELHAFDLFVADSPESARRQALGRLLQGCAQQHKDNLKVVDDCLLLDKVGDFHIHLEPQPQGAHWKPEWQGYQPIGVDAPGPG